MATIAMRRYPAFPLLLLSALLLTIIGCTSNPYTGRSQLLLGSEGQEMQMGEQAYGEILNDPKIVLSNNPAEVDPVQRVAKRIIAAAKQSKYAALANKFSWDVKVIKDDKTKNAWALPGGKMAVYTGIFPEAKNENGLAAIMGHEVVHALARHGAERQSQIQLGQLVVLGAAIGLEAKQASDTNKRLAMAALGLGLQVGVLLPYSRSHESEADYIGLLLAAQAGYDPRESVRLWQRMAQASQGAPPEFLSTHPGHDTRIADLNRWMPEAMAIYERSPKASVSELPKITPPPPAKKSVPQQG